MAACGAHHVFAHAAFPDVDAEFEQFTVDAGCTPGGVFTAHPADQVADFTRKRGSSQLAPPNLPHPEEAKALAVPGNDRLGLYDGQRRATVAPDAGQPGPQQTVQGSQLGAAVSCRTLKNADLVPERQVLQLKGSARTQDRIQSGKECRKKNEHQQRKR